MNERIQELAEQARQYADENRPGSFVKYDPEWFAFYNKKFAELIIKECIAMSTGQNQYKLGFQLAKDFSNHFGVKS
jgi:hypothetical protein